MPEPTTSPWDEAARVLDNFYHMIYQARARGERFVLDSETAGLVLEAMCITDAGLRDHAGEEVTEILGYQIYPHPVRVPQP